MVVSSTFSSAFVGAPSAWDSHGLSDVTSLYVQGGPKKGPQTHDHISQSRLATYARRGVIFDIHLTANLPRNLPVKKIL